MRAQSSYHHIPPHQQQKRQQSLDFTSSHPSLKPQPFPHLKSQTHQHNPQPQHGQTIQLRPKTSPQSRTRSLLHPPRSLSTQDIPPNKDPYITPQLRHRALKLESEYWDACFDCKKNGLSSTVESLDTRLERLEELINDYDNWRHRELRETFWEVELEQICERYRAWKGWGWLPYKKHHEALSGFKFAATEESRNLVRRFCEDNPDFEERRYSETQSEVRCRETPNLQEPCLNSRP